jgi:hypothetical protein
VTTTTHSPGRRAAAEHLLRRANASDAGQEDKNEWDLLLPHLLTNLRICSMMKEKQRPRGSMVAASS